MKNGSRLRKAGMVFDYSMKYGVNILVIGIVILTSPICMELVFS